MMSILLVVIVLALEQSGNCQPKKDTYVLKSCLPERDILADLPPGCKLSFKLAFNDPETGCPIRQVKCTPVSSTKSSVKSLNNRAEYDIQEDPVVPHNKPRITTGTEAEFQTKATDKLTAIRSALSGYNDPSFGKQFNFAADGKLTGTSLGFDNNIAPLHVAGLKGTGIVVIVNDDGVEVTNPDLDTAIDNSLLWNAVSSQSSTMSGDHGTSCAGLIAAKSGNNQCIVGIAPGVTLGAVKQVGFSITVTDEANSLTKFLDRAHHSSNSWGPDDDGKVLGMMEPITMQAVITGVTTGRSGRGLTYVFAAGNGGLQQDSCGMDGYVNNPNVFSAQSFFENGEVASYGEACAAQLTGAYIGQHNSPTVASSSAHPPLCKSVFQGTSAATPVISACIALIYQTNNSLTWRDVHAILIWASRAPQGASLHWQVTAAGLIRSEIGGFGVLDCTRAARFAKTWKNIGSLCVNSKTWGKMQTNWPDGQSYAEFNDLATLKQAMVLPEGAMKIEKGKTINLDFVLNSKQISGSYKYVTQQGQPSKSEGDSCKQEVVEKVLLTLQLAHVCRGSLIIWMVSPRGTISMALGPRPKDKFGGQFLVYFRMESFHGEPADGTWKLYFTDNGQCKSTVVQSSTLDYVGYVNWAKMETWATSASTSPYALNSGLIQPVLTSVGLEAIAAGKSHVLTSAEWTTVRMESKWASLQETAPTA